MSREDVQTHYGPWERDDTVTPAIGASHGLEGRYLGMRLFRSIRRKVFKTWVEDGQVYGSWDWQEGGVV